MTGFAIMGCGRISRKHCELLAQNEVEDARMVAVCDTQTDRAQAAGERYGVPWFANIHDLMQAVGDQVDVISILTESGNHARHTLEVVRYGKAILVEKPMALKLSDADAMIEACDRQGIRLFVVKQNRFNLPVEKLREALDEGRFGKLALGTVRVRWMREQDYYDQDAWRGTWALDGGVLANQAAHHIDLLTWCMGDVESVFAKSCTAGVQIEAEDTAVVVVKFVNGALGVIEATTAARPKNLEGSLSILGERGTVEIAGFAVNEMRHWAFREPRPEDEAVIAACSESPPNVYGFGHKKYLQHVVHCMQRGDRQLVDGLEGRRSLELIAAIYESIETQREVSLRFRPSKCRLGESG